MNPTTQHSNSVPSSMGTPTSLSSGNVAASVLTTMTQPTNNSNANVNYNRNLQNSANTTTTPPTNAPGKRLIRKITPIDPKKLQQAGLDRKIAEALSKQKIQTAKSTAVSKPNTFPSSSTPTSVIKPTQTTTSPSCSSTVIKSPPTLQSPPPTASQHLPSKIIIPPKITITGPDFNRTPTDLDAHLVGLTPEERLQHVKNLLNKKILLKQTSNTTETKSKKPEVLVHLKPPSPQKCTTIIIEKSSPSVGVIDFKDSVQTVAKTPSYQKIKTITKKTPSPNPTGLKEPMPITSPTNAKTLVNTSSQKLKTIWDKPPPIPPTGFVQLKESVQTTYSKNPLVNATSPELKRINDKPTPPPQTTSEGFAESLQTTPSNKSVIKIPQKSPQDIARKLDFKTDDEAPKILEFVRKNQTKFLYKDEKHSQKIFEMKTDIPKASIKPGANPKVNKIKQLMQGRQNIDFPEVSPLKIAFPTANVPQETPLPTIDTFKKPYSMPPSNYYHLQTEAQANNAAPVEYMTANYETLPPESTLQRFTNANDSNEASSSFAATTTNSNSLIVLENKVLSQDEMIDLTALRLSTSNVGAPLRFARPHKPIPEVVIKQENLDDFPTTECNKSLIMDGGEQRLPKTLVKSLNVQNDPAVDGGEDISTEMILLPAKQNKKIIINAQKLKLPPGKIAELAKKIAQTTSSQMPSNVSNKSNIAETQTQVKSAPISEIRILNRNTLPYAYRYGEDISHANNTESKQLVANQNLQSYFANRVIVQTKTYNDESQAEQMEKFDQTKITQVKQNSQSQTTTRTTTTKTEDNKFGQQQCSKQANQMNNPAQASTRTELALTPCDYNFNPNTKNSLIVNNDQIAREQQSNCIQFQTTQSNHNIKTSCPKDEIKGNRIDNTDVTNTPFVTNRKKNQDKVSVIVKEELQNVSPPKESYNNHHENLLRSPVIKPLPPHGLKKPTIKSEDTSNLPQTCPPYLNTSFIGYRKPAVEILDEPPDVEDSFSAVDFLAAFSNANPITEETTLELSPEELNLNASCAMNLSPLRIPSYCQRKRHVSSSQKQVTKPETLSLSTSSFQPNAGNSIEIGNIVTMQDISSQNVNFTMDNSQSMGTIVIQSSNGPETIVTKAPENKCPIVAIPGNKLKPVKIVNVLDSNKMGLPKLKNMEQPIKTTHTNFQDPKISRSLSAKSSTAFVVSFKDFLNKSNKYYECAPKSKALHAKLNVNKAQTNLTNKLRQTSLKSSFKATGKSVKVPVNATEKSVKVPINATEKSVKVPVNATEKSVKSSVKTPINSSSQEYIVKPSNTDTLKEKRPEPTELKEFKMAIKIIEKSGKLPDQATEMSVESPIKTTEKSVKSTVKTPIKLILTQNSKEDIEKIFRTETTEKLIITQNLQEDVEKLINTDTLNEKRPVINIGTKAEEIKSTFKTTENSAILPAKATEISVKTTEKSVKTPIKSILTQNSKEDIEKIISSELQECKPTQISVTSAVRTTEKSDKSPVKTPIILKQNSKEDIEMLINTKTTEKLPEPTESLEFTSTSGDCIPNKLPDKIAVKSPEKSVSFETILKPSLPTQLDQTKLTDSLEEMTQMNFKLNKKSLDLSKGTAAQTPQTSECKYTTNKYDNQKNLSTKMSIKTPEKPINLKSILKSNATADMQQQNQIETSVAMSTTTGQELVEFKSKDLAAAEDSSTKKPEEFKASKVSEPSKSNDSNSTNANVTTKRISRFRKAKINLVQRNKKSVTTAAKENSIEEDKLKSESSSGETKIADTTNIRAAAEDMLHSKESGSNIHNEIKIIPTSNDKISQNQIVNDVIDSLEKQDTDKVQQQDKLKDVDTSEYNDSQEISPDISNTKTSDSNTTGCNDTPQTHIVTSDPECLNTTEGTNTENSIKNTLSSPQYLDTTGNASNESEIKIQDTTTKLQNDLNENESITCDNQDNDKDICKDFTTSLGSGNEDNVLRTEQESAKMIKSPLKNISSLLQAPQTPKLANEKAEELSTDSKQILEELKQIKVSLVDIVKNSPTEISQKPPCIPFKKTCTETAKNTEEPKGINPLLKLKKSMENEYNDDLEKDNNENKQDEKNSTTFQNTKESSTITYTKVNNQIKENRLESEISSEELSTTTCEKATKPKRGRPSLKKVDKSILEKKEESSFNFHNSKEPTPLSSTKMQHIISENLFASEISSEESANIEKETKNRRGRTPLKVVDKSMLESKKDLGNSLKSTTNIKSKFNDYFQSEKSSEEPSTSETEIKRKRGRPSLKKIDKSIAGAKTDEQMSENKKHLSESEESTHLIARRSSRLSLNSESSLLSIKPINKKTRHSSRFHISDDDLEFLPINTEIKELKISKDTNKIKEKDRDESSPEKSLKGTHLSYKVTSIEATSNTDTFDVAKKTDLISNMFKSVDTSHEATQHAKRTRVSSRPLDNLEQQQDPESPLISETKRTRFSFHPCKTDDKNHSRFSSKPTDPEDSCQDSPHDVKLQHTKQRKKLRKTLEDIKKSSQRPYLDTDSDEDEQRDFDSINAFEEDNEFLGFEENSEESKKLPKHHDTTEDDNSKIIPTTTVSKGGTLKNWLTTGKAISPPLNKDPHAQRRREVKLSRDVPLKKRWDFAKNHHNETDITDDTSPADEEYDSETAFMRKRGLKNVIDSNKDMLDSKKTKLDENKLIPHIFREPQPVVKVTQTSSTDSVCQTVSSKKSKELVSEETDENVKNTREIVKMLDLSVSENLNKSTEVFDSIKVADISETSHTKISDSRSRKPEDFVMPAESLKEKKMAIKLPNSKEMIMNDDASESLAQAVIATVQSDADTDLHKIEDSYSKPANAQNRGNSSTISEITQANLSSKETSHKKQDSGGKTSSKPEKMNDDAADLEDITTPSKSDKTHKPLSKHKKSKVSKERNFPSPSKVDVTLSNTSQNSKMEHKKEIKESSKRYRQDIEVPHETPEFSTQTQEVTLTSKSKNFSKLGVKEDKTEDLHNTPKSSIKHKSSKVLKEKMKFIETEFVENKDEDKCSLLTPPSSTSKSKLLIKRPLETKDLTDECSPSIPKKRGRKPKPKIKDSSEDDCAPIIHKKRGHKRKYQIADSSDEDVPLSETNKKLNIPDNIQSITTPHDGASNELLPTPSSAVRRRRVADTPENIFNPRLLLITKREQLDNDEVLTDANRGTGDIQCALCLQRTTAKKWTLHLAEHYGIGWQVGGEKLNIENRSVVLSSIMNYYKYTDIKGLNCRMCNKLYRSALGVLQHIEACGAEAVRLKCEYCKRDFAKNSFPFHLRTCSERLQFENSLNEKVKKRVVEPQQEVFSNTGRLKRHSTIKAENKLKVLGAELAKNTVEPQEFNPQDLIHYVPPLNMEEVRKKCLEDIEQFGKGFCPKTICKFNSPTIDDLEKHINECKQKNTGYFCIPCKRQRFETEKQALQHIEINHKPGKVKKKADSDSDCSLKTDDEQSSEDENDLSEDVDELEIDRDEVEEDDNDDDIVDSDREYSYSQGRSANRNLKGYRNKRHHSQGAAHCRKRVYEARAIDLNVEVYDKWKKFLSLNYSSETIFSNFTTQYTTINNQDFAKYLPSQVSSMKFYMTNELKLNKAIGLPKSNIEWMTLKRFETMENKKTETFLFLGAPIKFVCWVPLPANVDEQYLVVGYRKEMFKFVKHTQPKQHKTVLIIFKVTLQNKVPKIELHYGFTINDGPVHCIAFLPSGGYDVSTNRLGLVAVATVNATTKVYSLPIKVEFEECDKIENVVIIDIKPSFQLNLDVIDQGQTEHMAMKPQCINIQWSETCGHNLIFAGFSNGFIGIWDITDDFQENLNRFVVENIVNFAVVNYFYIGEKGIHCFAIHYDSQGPRWLAVSARYRKFVIYDIKNLMMPIIIKDDWNKNILQCMDWCPLWGPVLAGYSDAVPNNGRCVLSISPINLMYTQQRVDYMCSAVTQIHYTPVVNMCVFTVDNGDIIFTDPREFHYEQPLGRKYDPCRRIVASMDIKQLDEKEIFIPPTKQQQSKAQNDSKLPLNWTIHELDYKEKYGLVFNSFIKIKEANKSVYMSEKRRPPIHITPYMRINSLRCNLNLNAKRLVAAGYENGFLRVIYFNKEYQFSKS